VTECRADVLISKPDCRASVTVDDPCHAVSKGVATELLAMTVIASFPSLTSADDPCGTQTRVGAA
jgi:hypothetical protein